MKNALKITTVGNSAGVVLPKEALARLRVKKGDLIYLTETARGFELSAYDAELEKQLEVAEEVMRKERTVLKKLAK